MVMGSAGAPSSAAVGTAAPEGLFVIGHARSGTTVLQYALNSSPDIFLFGEANFHNHGRQEEAFAAWYNQMHTQFRNPPAKGDRCPLVPGSYLDVMAHLRDHFRWVGEKVAFRDDSLGYSFASSYDFLLRHFQNASYICTLRNPLATLLSNREQFGFEDFGLYALSYAKCLLHLANTYMTFDRTLVAHYERIDQASFVRMGSFLESDLGEAFSEYDVARQTARAGSLDAVDHPDMGYIAAAYDRLSDLIDPATMRIPNRAALRRLQRELYQDVAAMEARHVVAPTSVDQATMSDADADLSSTS